MKRNKIIFGLAVLLCVFIIGLAFLLNYSNNQQKQVISWDGTRSDKDIMLEEKISQYLSEKTEDEFMHHGVVDNREFVSAHILRIEERDDEIEVWAKVLDEIWEKWSNNGTDYIYSSTFGENSVLYFAFDKNTMEIVDNFSPSTARELVNDAKMSWLSGYEYEDFGILRSELNQKIEDYFGIKCQINEAGACVGELQE